MTEHPEHSSKDEQLKKLQEQWEQEWGPEISPWKRRLSALFIFVAFVALIVVVMMTVS